ncbi:MAG: hypothetical protein HDT37_03760 [Clostridiales bacterium]|nr:hypothetical protein [Clostridiales bacterium]
MRRCCCGSQGQGGDLVAAAAALSVLIAQGKTAEQIELLSAVFDMLADNLATLALKAPSEEDCCCHEAEEKNEGRCS